MHEVGKRVVMVSYDLVTLWGFVDGWTKDRQEFLIEENSPSTYRESLFLDYPL